jgi:hypothetical protein
LSVTTDVVLVLAEEAPDAAAHLRTLPGVRSVLVSHIADGREYRIRGSDGADLRPAVYKLARERDWPLQELRRDVRTLETVFSELATASANDGTATGRGGSR